MNQNSDTLDIQPMAPHGASFGADPGQNGAEVEAARARIAALGDPHTGTLEPGQAVSLRPGIKVGGGLPPVPAPASPAAEAARPVNPIIAANTAAIPAEAAKTNHKRAKRKIPSPTKPLLSAIGSFILLMAIFKSQVIFSQIGYITHKVNTSAITSEAPAAVSAAPVISIPKINVNAPVVYEPSIAEAAVMKGLEGGVVHYGTSVMPGQNGNMVIVGHSSNDWWEPGNFKFVFVLLDKLAVGDEFKVNYQSRQYVYKVSSIKVVEPTDVSVLNNTPGPTATLITCTPPGTSWKRLVIKADQISPAPGVVTTPTTDNTSASDSPVQLPGNAPTITSQLSRAWHNVTSGVAGILGHQQTATEPPATSTEPGDNSSQGAVLPGAN